MNGSLMYIIAAIVVVPAALKLLADRLPATMIVSLGCGGFAALMIPILPLIGPWVSALIIPPAIMFAAEVGAKLKGKRHGHIRA